MKLKHNILYSFAFLQRPYLALSSAAAPLRTDGIDDVAPLEGVKTESSLVVRHRLL